MTPQEKTERFAAVRLRLVKLIELQAPEVVIVFAARSLLAAHAGGRWRAIFAWVGQILREKWEDLQFTVCFRALTLLGWSRDCAEAVALFGDPLRNHKRKGCNCSARGV